MRMWTDYPIHQLGDIENKEAPVRECELLHYDGDKYATVEVEGVITSFKGAYLYSRAGRFGEVPRVSRLTLRAKEPARFYRDFATSAAMAKDPQL